MTILGQHTVAETRDLMRALQFRINRIDEQWFKIQELRRGKTEAQERIDADWISFQRVWTDTRDKQAMLLGLSIGSNPNVHPAVLPAEPNYKAIIDVVQVRIPHLKDMEQRIDAEAAALQLPPTDLSGIPPQNSPDVDMRALAKLDAAIAAAGNPLGKPGGTDSVAKSPLGMILIGGAVIATLGGILYAKTVLRL